MILYHGTNLNIDSIDLSMCRPFKDFGTGFYLTEMPEQAKKMAKRVARIRGGDPVVNVFQCPDDLLNLSEVSVKDFGKDVSEEWARFVMNNRSRKFKDISNELCNLDNKYDVVTGPVADDDMAMLFRQYENEWIDFTTLIKGMTFKSTTNQYSFHTEKALSFLKKEGVLND